MADILNAKIYGTSDTAIYCGRPSKWGNPFIIGKDGTRKEVIEKYRKCITEQTDLLNSLHELKDKDLICWCYPKSCHCDILLELIETIFGGEFLYE